MKKHQKLICLQFEMGNLHSDNQNTLNIFFSKVHVILYKFGNPKSSFCWHLTIEGWPFIWIVCRRSVSLAGQGLEKCCLHHLGPPRVWQLADGPPKRWVPYSQTPPGSNCHCQRKLCKNLFERPTMQNFKMAVLTTNTVFSFCFFPIIDLPCR